MSEAGKLWSRLKVLPFEVRQYLLITGNYWAFTLTDGALRMLVVLYFHQLGYSPLEVALLFLLGKRIKWLILPLHESETDRHLIGLSG